MNDFGVPGNSIFMLNNKPGLSSKASDIYDPSDPWLGNTNLKDLYLKRTDGLSAASKLSVPFCVPGDEDSFELIDWLFRKDDTADLRMSIVKCDTDTGRWVEDVEWGECLVNQVSPVT